MSRIKNRLPRSRGAKGTRSKQPLAPLEEVAHMYQQMRRLSRCKLSTLNRTESWYRILVTILTEMVTDPQCDTELGPFLDLANLRQADIDEYARRRALRPVEWRSGGGTLRGKLPGNTTMANEIGALISLQRFAYTRELLTYLPPLQNLRIQRPHVNALSKEEVEKLLANCEHPLAYLLILLASQTGMRRAEMLHLQVKDFAGEFIHIRSKTFGHGRSWTTKTSEQREIPASTRVQKALTEHIASLEYREPTDFIFPGYSREQPFANSWRPVNQAFCAAGLYHERGRDALHALRRTWATHMLAAGVPLHDVMEIGGWRDIATVQRYLSSNRANRFAAIHKVFG